MGHNSTVYGSIIALGHQPPGWQALFQRNIEVLNNLPEEDEYPWITKWMFSTIPIDTQPIYREQIIHFGASYKQVESEWNVWLEKFEAILKTLYWFEVNLHLDTELVGDHHYTWVADVHAFDRENPRPTKVWTFEGGPRLFNI